MACHISFRDVHFHASTKGVRIQVWTDVPCHLWCRLTDRSPLIHKKPVYRRGLWIQDDIRVCFTVFEDNEQYEDNDTILHTFWKPNWPVCTTKHVYFWGSIAGEVCVSTSPFFKYHNDGATPIPVPRVLDVYTSIEPQVFQSDLANQWRPIDVSGITDEMARAVILHVINTYASGEVTFGLRKYTDPMNVTGRIGANEQLWACVGIGVDRTFHVWTDRPTYVQMYVMGYTTGRFYMFDESYDIFDGVTGSWSTYDMSLTLPDATAVILDVCPELSGTEFWALRCNGSAQELLAGERHRWQIVPLSNSHKFDFYWGDDFGKTVRLYLTGYITGEIFKHVTMRDVTPAGITGYQLQRVQWLSDNPVLVGLQYVSPTASLDSGAHKGRSLIASQRRMGNKGLPIPHPNPAGYCNICKVNANQKYYLSWELNTEL